MRQNWIFATIALSLILLVGVVSAIPANGTWHTGNVLYITGNGTGGSTSFPDLSPSGHTITPYGNAQVSTTTKLFGSGSVKLDGSGDSLGVSPSSDFTHTGNFSQSWSIYVTSLSSTRVIVCNANDNSDNPKMRLQVSSDGALQYLVKPAISGNLVTLASSNGVITTDKWYNITVSREIDTWTLYVNEASVATTLVSGTYPTMNSVPYHIGKQNYAQFEGYFAGYIDDAYIVNGQPLNVSGVIPSREYLTNPRAGFTADATTGNAPLTVQITDATLGNTPTAYSYRLTNVTGNNTELAPFSTSASPGVTLGVGNWLINQTVTNEFGDSSSYAFVNVSGQSITADFTASNNSGIQPLLVQFTDTSTTTLATIDSWAWDFGDGNTSTSQSPLHTYEIPGTHVANLTITNTSLSLVSTKLVTITVYNNDQPVADFLTFNNAGTATFTTYFYDTSYNPNPGPYTYYWDMGDGNTSTEQAFYYNYNLTGKFDVKHSITDSITTTWKNVTEAINVGTPTPAVIAPVASFYGSPTTGNVPLTVSFTDVSSNTPTSWNWSFGDGLYSELQNPSHQYNRSGFKNVALTATNSAGSNVTVRLKFVRVS
jgi:PKD repeat protein